jgi:2-C-methyl-D-erythritol 4-phosphate cytidylyltransferase
VSVAVIIAAAGSGERLGAGVPKALRPIGGIPMLAHAVREMTQATLVDLVVVAVPAGAVDTVMGLLREHAGAPGTLRVVEGGASRQQSVANALDALPPDVDVVLVHDAARPLAPSALADAVARAVLMGHGAVVPAVAMTDTVKRVHEGRSDSPETVIETVSRVHLRCVQTPQGFDRGVLVKAHAATSADDEAAATDDAGLVERLGLPVVVVPGSDLAFKITRPFDLNVAEAVLAARVGAGSADRVTDRLADDVG